MSEDQDLLARIGRLSGHINHYKFQTSSLRPNAPHTFKQPHAWNKSTSRYPNTTAPWPSSRGASYSHGGARVGKLAVNPRRNRTLVLNNKAGTHAQSDGESNPDSPQLGTNPIISGLSHGNEASQSANGWVTKRDRHMQLINTSIYNKETQVRNRAIEGTRKQKALRKDQREKQKIERHFKTLAPHAGYGAGTPTIHELTIDGLRFHVLDGGSKLARIRGSMDSASTTPKQANIGGVTFLRSKNGNLYRSGVVKAKRATGKPRRIPQLCKRFTPTDPATGSADDDDSDLVSDDDDSDSDDVDSDGLVDDSMQFSDDAVSQASHALSQQQDFVQF